MPAVCGYEVAIEQDDHYQNSILYNLFARRREENEGKQLDETLLRQIRERAKRQETARRQLSHQKK